VGTRLESPCLPLLLLVLHCFLSSASSSMLLACHYKPDRDWACNVRRELLICKKKKVSLYPSLFLFTSADILPHEAICLHCSVHYLLDTLWKLNIITHKPFYSPQSYQILVYGALSFLTTYLLLNNNSISKSLVVEGVLLSPHNLF
jgi:hypothetical protein